MVFSAITILCLSDVAFNIRFLAARCQDSKGSMDFLLGTAAHQRERIRDLGKTKKWLKRWIKLREMMSSCSLVR
jgi:hypothetical protein